MHVCMLVWLMAFFRSHTLSQACWLCCAPPLVVVFYRQTLAAVDGMVGSGGPKCRCGRWVSSFRSHDLAEKWQDPDLHKYVFLLGSAYLLMSILFIYSVSQTICCFLCLSHLHIRHVLWSVVVGVGGHQVAAFGRVQVLASVPGEGTKDMTRTSGWYWQQWFSGAWSASTEPRTIHSGYQRHKKTSGWHWVQRFSGAWFGL